MGKFRVLRLSKAQLLGCIFCVLLGIGMIVGATIYKNHLREKQSAWVRTDATVVHVDQNRETDRDGDIRYMYREVVEYTVYGITYRAKNDTWTNSPKYVGDSCPILYNPLNPSECIFVSTSQGWIPILYIAGSILGFAGAVGIVYYFIGNAQHKKRENNM